MSSKSLPPGCRIRKAKFTDLPQLILQIFESKSFIAYLEMKNWFFFVLAIAVFLDYRISFNFTKELYLYSSIIFTLFWLRNLYSQAWVIESNHQIIASVKFNCYTSRLDNLYVKPQYRRQGIASYLVKYLQKQFNKSIFIICDAKLVNFFEHIGFIKALGDEEQLAWGKAKNRITITLYSPKESIELTASETRILFKQQIDKCSIRHANKKDIESIHKLNLFNQTMDYFLPFGSNFIWAGKIAGWIFRFAFWQFIFLNYQIMTITTLYKSYKSTIYLFYSSIFLCSILILLLVIFEFNKNYRLAKYPLFILLEYDNQTIGYVRFWKQKKYFILNHVYLPTSLEPEIMTYFIQQVIDLIAQPMFIACTKQEEQFYRNIGFLQIHIQKLPKKLRLGGWFNELFGGRNLVYISKK